MKLTDRIRNFFNAVTHADQLVAQSRELIQENGTLSRKLQGATETLDADNAEQATAVESIGLYDPSAEWYLRLEDNDPYWDVFEYCSFLNNAQEEIRNLESVIAYEKSDSTNIRSSITGTNAWVEKHNENIAELESILQKMKFKIENTARIPEAIQEKEPDSSPTRHSAQTLPTGWEWVKYDDGSGHLEGPEGQQFFSYDLSPYASSNGVEFKETDADRWSVFWNSPDKDFWTHAEERVRDQYLPTQEQAAACDLAPETAYEIEM